MEWLNGLEVVGRGGVTYYEIEDGWVYADAGGWIPGHADSFEEAVKNVAAMKEISTGTDSTDTVEA